MKRIAIVSLMVILLLIPIIGVNCDSNGNGDEDNNKDTTPPVISGITVSDITESAAIISWTTDELATSNIEYGPDTSYGYSYPSPADTTADKTNHSVTLSGLSPDTAYHFRIRSADSADNDAVSGDNSFTTKIETSNKNITLEQAFPELEFDHPVALLQIPGDSSRWFIIETQGRVKTFEAFSTVTDAEIVLDISDRVISGGERGLLGMAFHPRFAENGFVYLSYTASDNGQLISRISRFSMSAEHFEVDADSELVILSLEQPYANHNGGYIAFGPDGHLYIGFGDGGDAGDPEDNAQNTSTLLGAILRIDVDGGLPYTIPADNPFAESISCESGGCPEIFAWGLRNPWRWSFDSETGELWAGDVGQNQWEEIDIISIGGNYGWNIREGSQCYQATDCASESLVQPVAEYPHSEGCSVTGGYVYRGDKLTDLYGIYIYGDYCSGNIWGLRPSGEEYQTELLISSELAISSFGQAINGEVYVLDYDGGGIFQLAKVT